MYTEMIQSYAESVREKESERHTDRVKEPSAILWKYLIVPLNACHAWTCCWYMAQASLCCRMWEKHPIDAKIRTGRKQGVGWQRQATGEDERVGVREECSLFTRFSLSETHTHSQYNSYERKVTLQLFTVRVADTEVWNFNKLYDSFIRRWASRRTCAGAVSLPDSLYGLLRHLRGLTDTR